VGRSDGDCLAQEAAEAIKAQASGSSDQKETATIA